MTRTTLINVLKEKILPLPPNADDEQAWVDRLLLVARHLDEQAMNGLAGATGLKHYARCVSTPVPLCWR
jgi:sister-chromatid-cohesion protein PDS5